MSGPLQADLGALAERLRRSTNVAVLPETPPCSVCRGAGRLGWGEYEYGPCSECELGMAAMGVPVRFRSARLSDFDGIGDMTAFRKWQGEVPGWYLYGAVGAGKTHLAAALCRQVAAQCRVARFLQVSQFLDLMRQSYGDEDGQMEVRWVQDRLGRADVVVLDDLGGERPTPWAAEQMLTLVNRLYNREVGLIVTSNLTPSDLAKGKPRGEAGPPLEPYLDARAVSRLVELTQTVELDLPDRRAARRL